MLVLAAIALVIFALYKIDSLMAWKKIQKSAK